MPVVSMPVVRLSTPRERVPTGTEILGSFWMTMPRRAVVVREETLTPAGICLLFGGGGLLPRARQDAQ
jgi:hypothetical protein